MSRITMLKGLPGAGKSTLAKKMWEENGNAVRLNKDLLRQMLHFSKFTGPNEGITKEAEKLLAMYILTSTNKSLIIDDTNMREEDWQFWKGIAELTNVTISKKELKTPLAQCIENDWNRDKKDQVGYDVIMKMALRHGIDVSAQAPKKNWVLVDIDGTLANISHRRKYVESEPKNWVKFFEKMSGDTLNQDTHDIVKSLAKRNNIILCSGRPERYRGDTEAWLAKHCDFDYVTILMRPDGNSRPDYEVKKKIYEDYLARLPIKLVIDDRPSVIRMWRELGLQVLDVGEGVDF